MNKLLCPFCSSEEVYIARHDSDWGGGNSFYPLNKPYYEDLELNLDIKTNYCKDCQSFGDFESIYAMIEERNSER